MLCEQEWEWPPQLLMQRRRQSSYCGALVLATCPGLGLEGAALLEGGDAGPFFTRSAKPSSDSVGSHMAFLCVDAVVASQVDLPLSPYLNRNWWSPPGKSR